MRAILLALVAAGACAVVAFAAVDPKAVPLGDGHVSTSPRVGYVDACNTRFGGGGAQAAGPWIDAAAGTWDSTAKAAVAGEVSWSGAWSAKVVGAKRIVTSNDLPVGHTSGTFPVASTDPASAYDRNPNRIAAHTISWSLPATPVAAARPTCTSMGTIGILNDGVVLYNALDGQGRDAAAHEVLDSCAGHPDMSSTYHHHDVPPCILAKATGASTLVGYAIDGYGIYVERDSNGALLSNAALDVCHGRTSTIAWNGKKVSLYHYVATLEYPYTVGCFHGTPISVR